MLLRINEIIYAISNIEITSFILQLMVEVWTLLAPHKWI